MTPSVLDVTVACLLALCSKDISPNTSPAWQFFKNCTLFFLYYFYSPLYEHQQNPSSIKYMLSPNSPYVMITWLFQVFSWNMLSIRKFCSCWSKSLKRNELEKQNLIIICVLYYFTPAFLRLIGLRRALNILFAYELTPTLLFLNELYSFYRRILTNSISLTSSYKKGLSSSQHSLRL